MSFRFSTIFFRAISACLALPLMVAAQGHSIAAKSAVGDYPRGVQQSEQTTQPQPLQQSSPVVKQEVHHDVSPPLYLIPPPPRQPGLRIHDIEPIPRSYQPAAVDPVLQPSYPTTQAPVTTLNFDGVGSGFTGPAGTFTVQSAPPDTNGDVGPNHYVQIVNTDFAIFNKSGTAIFGPVPINTLWQGFGGLCQSDNDGDPIVIYDPIADRWVISQFAVTGANGTSVPFLQCVAVSQTADPTGSYNRYSFGYNAFNDYPKMGVWPDAYYTTFNLFNASGTAFLGGEVCAYDRTSMLAGQPATQQCFNVGTNFGGLLPSDLDGAQLPPAGSPNYVLALGVSNNDLAFWKFHVDWVTPANTTLTGPITLTVATYTAACNGGTCIPQTGTSQLLDSLADRLMYRLAYRNFGSHESLVANHSVSAGSGVGVRWYEIRSPGATPTVFQQGTYAPDSNFRWMGSMAMDQNGDIALGFSVSGSSLHPEIHYTGRLVGDPLGQMTQGEGTIIDGAGSQTAVLSRWGDYSMMGIDPSDDCTFWYTTEYLKASGRFNWSTRIANFNFPNCGVPPIPDFSLSTSPSSVTVTAGFPASYTESITATGGFAGSVSLSISGLPAGASGSFNPNPATGASSALTVTTSSTTPAGSYIFTVTGTSTSPVLTHTSTATLVVQSALPPPPIAFVRAANNLIPVAGTSVSVAMINNASDTLVVACRESAQVAITSVTDTAGNSYTKIANALSTGRESALFFAANIKASAANTISCNFASSAGREAIVVEEFSGVVALDGSVTASNNGTVTSLPSGNLTTTNGIDLLVYEVNVGADSTFTAGAGYTIPSGGSNARLAMQFTTVSSQGTYSTLESWSPAAPADGIFAAFKAASGGSTAPSITSLNPSSGPMGASVTITGANFGTSQGTSTVMFSGGGATPTSWSPTSISVPVPNLLFTANTIVSVVVTVGGVASNSVAFTYLPTPSITGTSLGSGPAGTPVTISGSNFGASQGTSTVTFSGTVATPTNWSATSISAPVPAGATTGNIVVTVGGVASNGALFVVIPTPSITSLNPTSGPVSTFVTITGTNFGATQGTVTFNGTFAGSASWSSTSIIAAVPNGATTGNVVVTSTAASGGVASNGVLFTVTTSAPGPSITSISPTLGPVGASVSILGSNFGASQGTSTVTFHGIAATPTSWSATGIFAPVPSGATTGNVVVTVGGVASNGINFAVVPPNISSLSPNFGITGTPVTIFGTNFGATQGTSTVTFNGTTATATSWSDTSIVAPVPTGATNGNVVVNVGALASNGVNFTVGPPPNISLLSPTSGPRGTPVTITGTNFGATQGTGFVRFSGVTATPMSWSATSISVPVPPGAPTGNDLVDVIAAGGAASNQAIFTVTFPSITSVSPTSGATGTLVAITGTNFGASQGTSTVTFNGTAATPTSWSATSIVAPVPAGATTGNVVVTVGGIATNGPLFTVTTPDFSLSTTPSSATVTAGSPASYTENITATGGFTGSVSLSVSGLPAGASGTFNPNPASGASSALTVTTSSTTPAGSYVFTVTGTSTSPALTHTSTATLVVQSALPPPPIAFVRAANNLIPTSATSVSVANMVNNVADMLVVACRESAQITITSVTDTAGNSYTRIANALSTGRESALFFAATIKASSGNTISCNFASSAGREAIVVEEFSGVVALDGSVTASNNATVTSLPSGNLATTNGIDLLVYEVNVGADSTFTAGPGYTIPPGGSNTRLAMQFMTVTSQGTYSTSESWSTAAPADGIFAALK